MEAAAPSPTLNLGIIAVMIDYLREKFPLNRVVIAVTAIVTPIAATVAGGACAWLADHLPFMANTIQANSVEITGIFVTIATATAAAIIVGLYRWLVGWAQHEKLIHEHVSALTAMPVATVPPRQLGEPTYDEPGADMRRALKDKPQPGGEIKPVGEGDEYHGV